MDKTEAAHWWLYCSGVLGEALSLGSFLPGPQRLYRASFEIEEKAAHMLCTPAEMALPESP